MWIFIYTNSYVQMHTFFTYIGELSKFSLMGFEKRFQNISSLLSYQDFSEQYLQMPCTWVYHFVRGAQKKTPSHWNSGWRSLAESTDVIKIEQDEKTDCNIVRVDIVRGCTNITKLPP